MSRSPSVRESERLTADHVIVLAITCCMRKTGSRPYNKGRWRATIRRIIMTQSILEAAASLHMSRSNVYSSLRRISRKLGTRSVRELLHLVRHGDLFN